MGHGDEFAHAPMRPCAYAPMHRYNRAMEAVLAALARALERGEAAALVTIIAAHGSTPQRVGAKMLVFADGRTVGTIGGGCYENDAFWKARDALRQRRPQVVHYELNDDMAEESGLICGGQMDVFIEPIEPAPRLYVLGAGHVGYQLGQIAPTVGFRLHVADDREKFANHERFPAADEIIVDTLAEWVGRDEIPAAAYVVVLTRGHRQDFDVLRALARRDYHYVGLIGSRAKVARLTDALLAAGVSPDWLRRLHAPIGFDIGAVSPEEIAVAILAELIAARRGKVAGHSTEPSSLQWTAPVLEK
jgi:xanthine dehydrogenase accessory factor